MIKDDVSYIGEYFGEKMTHSNLAEWESDISKKEGVRPVATLPPIDVFMKETCCVNENVSRMILKGKLVKGDTK